MKLWLHSPLTFMFRLFQGAQCRVNEGFPKPDTECKLGDIGFRYEILGTRLEETLPLETEWEQIYWDKDVYGSQSHTYTISILNQDLNLYCPIYFAYGRKYHQILSNIMKFYKYYQICHQSPMLGQLIHYHLKSV